jgi:hypothetical protein
MKVATRSWACSKNSRAALKRPTFMALLYDGTQDAHLLQFLAFSELSTLKIQSLVKRLFEIVYVWSLFRYLE